MHGYVAHVAPDLSRALERYEPARAGADVFAAYRIDEQIAKGLDRKVWLPSGGSLIIDRTEAMTVVDVNTGKFTGSGGNLEETVTKNNLEAAEEIVRQLRLRDIGGIIVIDFIDMVLESNRDLVLRRLVECLGRDRTRHQVAEVTSLGLVQMTRKRIGTGLLEAFSETCDHCNGRGLILRDAPVEPKRAEEEPRRGRRSRRGRGGDAPATTPARPVVPSPKDLATVARPDSVTERDDEGVEPQDVAGDAGDPTETVNDDLMSPDLASADDPAAEAAPETVVAPSLDESPLEEPEVEEPEVEEPPTDPEPPKVITRTRKRSASRPAGPPALPAAGPVLALQVGGVAEDGLAEPGTVSVEPGTGADDDDELAEHDEHGDAPTIGHVPIKRRSRKR